MIKVDNHELTEGKFYLWRVAQQAGTGVDLHSVYFITEDDKVFEVVFTKQSDNTIANSWYLVEKKVVQKTEPIEGEVVEPMPVAEPTIEQDPNTLSVNIADQTTVTEKIN